MSKSDERNRRNLKSRKVVFMPVPVSENRMPDSYSVFFKDLKKRIQQERLKVVLSANSALVMMYWDIGNSILQKQNNEGWGAKVIDRLSHDLKEAFPEMSGLSPRNLKYMRKFAESWPEKEIVQEVLAQITWYHNLALLEKLKESELRLWYARQTSNNGWSRNILVVQIETRLHERIGRSTNNFKITLPPIDSDMANQVFKDPYVFDFLGTADGVAEWEKQITDSLPEDLKSSLPTIEEIELEMGKNELKKE